VFADIIDHFCKRSSGEENVVDAFALHSRSVLMRDRSAAAAEDFDVVRATLSQKSNDFSEEFDMPAVVTRDADGAHVLLNGGAHNVANRTMIAKIDDFDPVPDEFQIDRVNGAVMPVANRDRG
jgi:hypothetical protein